MKTKYRSMLSFFTFFLLFLSLVWCAETKAISDFVISWGAEKSDRGQLDEPFDAVVGPKGHLYVTDARQQKVLKFDPDGKFVLQWGDAKRFEKPTGITVSEDGFVYVSDYDNDHILKFKSDGTFIKQWGRSGEGEGEFDSPSGLAVDAAGNVYVTDLYNHRIQKFSGNKK
ncbi:hypothetical protein MNBD_NITROSPIRAE01-2199 [hydrothermal vent metagenome]|uniref:6-bladed beta-propeller n=1 Tax=hydrothermal vent metagenome TaxID=652676 RepID=A0A3B1DXN2_9ZZZZ